MSDPVWPTPAEILTGGGLRACSRESPPGETIERMNETPSERTALTPGPVPARLPQPAGFVHNLRRFTAWLFGMAALTLWGVGIWHADWTYLWLSVPPIVAALVTDPGKGM